MLPTMPSTAIVIAAGILLLLASAVRAVRLYISLGELRPRLHSVFSMHFLGTVLGYFSGAFVYEVVVIICCSFCKSSRIIPTVVSLMIVRGPDAAMLLVMALTVLSTSNMRPLIFFLMLLLVLIWFSIHSMAPILKRFERNIIEAPIPIKNDVGILAFSYKLRQNLAKLPWEKKGTMAMMILLSMAAWLLEWVSVYLLCTSAQQATELVVGRVAGSVGLTGVAASGVYNQIMPAVYAGLVLSLVGSGVWIFRQIRKTGGQCHL